MSKHAKAGNGIPNQRTCVCPVCKTELKTVLVIDNYINEKGNRKMRKHFVKKCYKCDREVLNKVWKKYG